VKGEGDKERGEGGEREGRRREGRRGRGGGEQETLSLVICTGVWGSYHLPCRGRFLLLSLLPPPPPPSLSLSPPFLPTSANDLRQFFHLKLFEVSQIFGVCVNSMKKICRKCNIHRWPQRCVYLTCAVCCYYITVRQHALLAAFTLSLHAI
jgi:hypothetical protein